MNYETFKDIIAEKLQVMIPEPKQVNPVSVTKNNGQKMDAVTVISGKANIGPTIYLEPFFKMYEEGATIDEICGMIIRRYEANKFDAQLDVSFFGELEKVRHRIMPKLINAEANKKTLQGQPYVPYLDLALTFVIAFPFGEEVNATIAVTDQFAKMWNVTPNDLYEIAMENASRPHLSDINSMLGQILASNMAGEASFDVTNADDLNDGDGPIPHDGPTPMFVLTNTENLFGAETIARQGLLETYARRFGCGMYILPSSINEILLIPSDDGGERMDEFTNMVQEVNETQVAPEEVLSDHAYFFNLETGEITYPKCA